MCEKSRRARAGSKGRKCGSGVCVCVERVVAEFGELTSEVTTSNVGPPCETVHGWVNNDE